MLQNLIDQRGGNIAFSRGALRQGQVNNNGAWNYNQFQTQNTVHFTIDGVFGSLAPSDNQVFSTGHNTIIGCNVCIFALWVNNTNVIASTQGPSVDPALIGGSGAVSKLAIRLPDVVTNNVLIGLVKVKVGVGATFVPRNTNFNATNITTTFFDTSTMPAAPQQS
jgi:hypothetical protein